MPLVVGTEWSNNYLDRSFKGKMDEVKVWRGVRSLDDIRNDMNPGLPSSSNGMLLYWNFDEGKGNITNDQSGGNNTGTLNNMTKESWVNSSIPLYFSIPENPTVGSKIATIPFGDPDPGDTVTLTLVELMQHLLKSAKGAYSGIHNHDYERFSYDLIVSAFDGKLSVDQQVSLMYRICQNLQENML